MKKIEPTTLPNGMVYYTTMIEGFPSMFTVVENCEEEVSYKNGKAYATHIYKEGKQSTFMNNGDHETLIKEILSNKIYELSDEFYQMNKHFDQSKKVV